MAYIVFYPSPKVEVKEVVKIRDSLVCDTLRDTVFKTITKYVVRHDTVRINDTVYQLIPITRHEFKDSSYWFVVDGYGVKPIFLETYPQTRYITTEIVRKETKIQRLTHGVNLGVGMLYGTKGLDVGFYVGYGITVKF